MTWCKLLSVHVCVVLCCGHFGHYCMFLLSRTEKLYSSENAEKVERCRNRFGFLKHFLLELLRPSVISP